MGQDVWSKLCKLSSTYGGMLGLDQPDVSHDYVLTRVQESRIIERHFGLNHSHTPDVPPQVLQRILKNIGFPTHLLSQAALKEAILKDCLGFVEHLRDCYFLKPSRPTLARTVCEELGLAQCYWPAAEQTTNAPRLDSPVARALCLQDFTNGVLRSLHCRASTPAELLTMCSESPRDIRYLIYRTYLDRPSSLLSLGTGRCLEFRPPRITNWIDRVFTLIDSLELRELEPFWTEEEASRLKHANSLGLEPLCRRFDEFRVFLGLPTVAEFEQFLKEYSENESFSLYVDCN